MAGDHPGGCGPGPAAVHHPGLEQAVHLRVLDRLSHSDILRLLHRDRGTARPGLIQQVLPQLHQGGDTHVARSVNE